MEYISNTAAAHMHRHRADAHHTQMHTAAAHLITKEIHTAAAHCTQTTQAQIHTAAAHCTQTTQAQIHSSCSPAHRLHKHRYTQQLLTCTQTSKSCIWGCIPELMTPLARSARLLPSTTARGTAYCRQEGIASQLGSCHPQLQGAHHTAGSKLWQAS